MAQPALIQIHAAYVEESLVWWAECDRRKKVKKSDHPFALSATAIAAAFETEPDDDSLEHAYVWLPSDDHEPIPSTTQLFPDRELTEATRLAAWRVPVWRVTPVSALQLLTGDSPIVATSRTTPDVRFWLQALQLAVALYAREEYIPSLHEIGSSYFAHWDAVLTGTSADHAERLAQAMPDIARAVTFDATKPPSLSKRQALQQFLNAMVDVLVRENRQGGPNASYLLDESSSVHQEWIQRLQAADPQMRGSAADLKTFHRRVREWQRPLMTLARAPYRLCFQLLEAREEDLGMKEPWYVDYVLQSRADPSLLLDIEDAWNEGAPQLPKARMREFILLALGQARTLLPQIDEDLGDSMPFGFPLSTDAAFRFLSTQAPLLDQNGYGLLLPAWWTRQGGARRLSLQAKVNSPRMKVKGGLSLETIVEFDWKAALGDLNLTAKELQSLARQKHQLVFLRGQWVHVNREDIQRALAFVQKGSGSMTLREVVQTALGKDPAESGLPGEVVATGWIGELLDRLKNQSELELLTPPKEFHGSLRPYQVRGLSWMAFLRQWGLGACLADDMGLGKTVQTLALLAHARAGGEQRPTLLVCPTSVVGNWRKEAERFTPDLPTLIHHGAGREKKEFGKLAKSHALVISTYALLLRDIESLKNVEWAAVVLDEAQNIKNPDAKQSRAARAVQADFRLALTGTPVENHVGDLWSLMDFLQPGLLGTLSEFRKEFLRPLQVYRDPWAGERLKKLTGPFLLRRLKTDKSIIADLPDKIEQKVYCPLTKEQATLYQAVVDSATGKIEAAEGIERKGLVLATLTRLKQICNHPVQYLQDQSGLTAQGGASRSGKLTRLTEMMEEVLEAGDRTLIFTQFTEMGTLLRSHLSAHFGCEVLYLHGGVTQTAREAMVRRFQEEQGPPIFLLSLKAGGTGLNLTRANHVFHYDRWWNPAVEDQATDRAFRIGQQRNVQVHKFLCLGTMEEKIDEMIERKQGVAREVVGTGEGWLTELSNDDLRDLFTLRQESFA